MREYLILRYVPTDDDADDDADAAADDDLSRLDYGQNVKERSCQATTSHSISAVSIKEAYTLGLPHKFAAYESVLLHSKPCNTLFTAMFDHVLTEQNPFINKAIHVYTWIRDFACKIPGPSQN